MTPHVTETAINLLSEAADELQGWLAENKDRQCDRGLLGDAMRAWLEQRIEELCESAADLVKRDYAAYKDLMQHLERAEALEVRYQAVQEREDYQHFAA